MDGFKAAGHTHLIVVEGIMHNRAVCGGCCEVLTTQQDILNHGWKLINHRVYCSRDCYEKLDKCLDCGGTGRSLVSYCTKCQATGLRREEKIND